MMWRSSAPVTRFGRHSANYRKADHMEWGETPCLTQRGCLEVVLRQNTSGSLHGPHCQKHCFSGVTSGGPRRIRTPDPLIRSQVLYPAELSVRVGEAVFRPGVRDVQPDSSKIIQKPISPRGSLISKTVPSGPVLVSTNSPPWPRTSSCEIARPRPEPPLRTPP